MWPIMLILQGNYRPCVVWGHCGDFFCVHLKKKDYFSVEFGIRVGHKRNLVDICKKAAEQPPFLCQLTPFLVWDGTQAPSSSPLLPALPGVPGTPWKDWIIPQFTQFDRVGGHLLLWIAFAS